ncbi:MAG: hypothetical protein WAT78_12090 [Rhizobiaceae bacterium]
MNTSQTADSIRAIDPHFMMRVFQLFVALAIIALLLSLAGRWLGHSISRGGHTASLAFREIVIGNDVIRVPENAIRFETQRHDGVAKRLDLYFHLPDMTGYTDAARDDFNNAGSGKNIVFVSLEPRVMSRDMTGRLEPIYRSLILEPGIAGEGGATLYGFRPDSGYMDELLAVTDGQDRLVARCMTGPEASETLAACERDIHVGEDLSLTYRFPRETLANWADLEAAIRAKAAELVAAD